MPVSIPVGSATQKLSRTTNLLAASSDYSCTFYARAQSVPGAGDYICFMTLKDAGYTKYAGIFTQNGSLATNVEVNNGGGQFDTAQSVLTVDTWTTFAYVRSGTTHTFYAKGSLVGSTTSDFSAVTWTELLIGYDGFSVNDFQIWGFREFNVALTSLQVRLQWESAVPLAIPTPATTTSLLADLLDESGNAHDWTATPAAATFVAGPADTSPLTYPLTMLTGSWVRWSTIGTGGVPNKIYSLNILSGMTLSLGNGTPTGGRTIARASLRWVSFAAGGLPGAQVWNSSHMALDVEYMDASTFNLVTGATVPDPWVDPFVGTPLPAPDGSGSTITYSTVPPHRLAMAITASTQTGAAYNTDGEVQVYVDDVLVANLTGLHFADRHPFTPSPSVAVAYGVEGVVDHAWARFDDGTPSTDANGVVLDTTGLWYQDDFATADVTPIAWGPFLAKTGGLPEVYPHIVADVGGAGGAGLSNSNATAAQFPLENGAPFLNGCGIVRLRWNGTASGSPLPPLPPPAGVSSSVEITRQWKLLRFDLKPRTEETA